jgi:hypothetical protein
MIETFIPDVIEYLQSDDDSYLVEGFDVIRNDPESSQNG